MTSERKQLILDHLYGLLTMQQVADKIGCSVQRAYQLKQKLWRDYRVPMKYQTDGPACAHWVAMQDYRNQPEYGTSMWFYYNERFGSS